MAPPATIKYLTHNGSPVFSAADFAIDLVFSIAARPGKLCG